MYILFTTSRRCAFDRRVNLVISLLISSVLKRGERWRSVQTCGFWLFHQGHKQENVSHETRIMLKITRAFSEAKKSYSSLFTWKVFFINTILIKPSILIFLFNLSELDCSKKKAMPFAQLVLGGLSYRRYFAFCVLCMVNERIDWTNFLRFLLIFGFLIEVQHKNSPVHDIHRQN